MARQRDNLPPYEIMRTGMREPSQPSEVLNSIEGDSEPASCFTNRAGPGAPIVLRVPRGMVVLFCAICLVLLVIAYWVGHDQGISSAREQLGEQRHARLRTEERWRRPQLPPQTIDRGPIREPVPITASRPGPTPTRSIFEDPRKQGLNYLILATYKMEDARKLHNFLAERDVECFIVPSRNKLYHVIVGKGVAPRSPEFARLERNLRELGRDWKAHNGGGDDLSSMYFQSYKGLQKKADANES